MAEVKRYSRLNEHVLSQEQSTESDNTENYNSSLQEPSLQSLVWKDLTSEQVLSLIPLTPKELEAKLAKICSCYKYKICLKEACILDYYVSAIWFSKNNNFTTEQMSAFFSLIKVLLENIREQQMPLVKNIVQLKKYMKSIVHEKHKKQTSHAIFNVAQSKLITDYVTESLFQHYKLYELLFSAGTSDKDAINQTLLVEVPPKAEFPFPPPLDEGIPEDVYTEYVLVSVQPSQDDGDTTLKIKDEKNEKPQTPIPIQDQTHASDKDNANEGIGSILNQLEPEEIKDVLRTVSHGILNEVKSGVQKKLKERESVILSKISKK